MSRRVVITVPISTGATASGAELIEVIDRLTASFAIIGDRAAPTVQRAGRLVEKLRTDASVDHDPLVAAFMAMCRQANQAMPAGLRVRASSNAPGSSSGRAAIACAAAGAAAANALLRLGASDDDLANAAAEVVGHLDEVVALLDQCRITVHHDCDDGLEAVQTQSGSVQQ